MWLTVTHTLGGNVKKRKSCKVLDQRTVHKTSLFPSLDYYINSFIKYWQGLMQVICKSLHSKGLHVPNRKSMGSYIRQTGTWLRIVWKICNLLTLEFRWMTWSNIVYGRERNLQTGKTHRCFPLLFFLSDCFHKLAILILRLINYFTSVHLYGQIIRPPLYAFVCEDRPSYYRDIKTDR